MSCSSSSISTTSSLPARQEVTSGARVHGEWRSGAAGLPTPVEHWTTSLSGVQLLYPTRLQAAGVPKPNAPSAPPALCTTGRTQLIILVSCLFDREMWKQVNLELNFPCVSGPGCSNLLPPEHHIGCECVCGPSFPQYQPVCHPHCGHRPAQLATGNRVT